MSDDSIRLVEIDGDLEGIKETLKRLEKKVDKTADSSLAPKNPTNVAQWVTTAIAGVTILGAVGMAVIAPIKEDIQYLTQAYENNLRRSEDSVFELGKQTSELLEIQEDLVELHKKFHESDKNIEDIEKELSELKLKLAILTQRVEGNEKRFEAAIQLNNSSLKESIARINEQIKELLNMFQEAHSAGPK